jgi:hypothetical protein
MSELLNYAQFGVGIVAIAAIVTIVKAFLKSIKEKDEQFTEVVKNHLQHDIESRNQLEKSHQRLADMIEQLLRWLERNNHN